MNMKQSCKALICAIEGELDGRHCTEEQAAAILDHALPSLTESLAQVQSQLAEAVGLLRYAMESSSFREILTLERDIAAFLARHTQAEQQEAQGAQAEPANFGQELEAFEKWRHTQADSLRRCGYPEGADAFIRLGSVQWAGWQARAALATQPAAGEPVAEFFVDFDTLRKALSIYGLAAPVSNEELGLQMDRQAVRVIEAVARLPFPYPPAAAHGDEAVRKDAEAAYIEMTCQPVLIDGAHHYYLSSERMQAFDRLFSVDVSDAAIRAQVDGGIGDA